MNQASITIHIEVSEKRRSIHGTVAFAKSATKEDAIAALKANGFDHTSVPDGFRRTMFDLTNRFGENHFQFFFADEAIPPEPPPKPQPPPSDDRRVG